jgi:uncharacterized protein
MSEAAARYPYEAPVTAYGNGGFRFAEMSHKGSILCLPSGVYAWEPSAPADLVADHFARVFADLKRPGVLLLGSGSHQTYPPIDVIAAFIDTRINLEVMATGAAVRTYNIMLGEKRVVAAALIAVA